MEVVPFEHQMAWWAASDGKMLLDVSDQAGCEIRLPDGSTTRRMIVERPNGRARFIADLGAFKIGKSFGVGIWASGFAVAPDARISIIGLEYDICAPEFDYICEALLSERGMGMKYTSLQNRPRDGKMWLDLPNGCRYEARSWERKDSLKGKEIDVYIYAEAYQLPGIECFTSFSQNLRVRQGFAIFPTTPDRPWVKELHNLGHGLDSEWHCTCSVPADVNPYSFSQRDKDRDKTLMTTEKFKIHYLGQLGDFVGKVFNYQRGQLLFNEMPIPANWEIVAAADTGTFYTALIVAFSPDGAAYVLEEFPNYRYVAGLPERNDDVTIPAWATGVVNETIKLGGRPHYWADKNSQFKKELSAYGMSLLGATAPVETRTEIAREYFQHGKIHLASHLSVLPFELENAAWPPEASSTGKFARIKDRDHTLDCLEHILARRPRGNVIVAPTRPKSWAESMYRLKQKPHNTHLGRN